VRGASGWNPPRGSRSNALTHHCQSAGRGYHTREVETFDAPLIDQNANREMFEESVEVMFKAFEGKPFSHQGKYYTIPPEVPYRGYTLKEITLVPAPERPPVECWRWPDRGGPRLERRSRNPADRVRANQKLSRNFPRFADLVDHFNGERAPARENFRCARPRSQELAELGLGVPELLDRMTQYVDRVKTLGAVDRPPLRFV
jgi:hypothetical protein